MSKIIKTINQETRKNTVKRCREKGIIIPTFAQLKNPELMPEKINHFIKGKTDLIEKYFESPPTFFEDPYLKFIKPDLSRDWKRHLENVCKHITV